MIDTERKEDLFLDTKLIKSENRLGKLRIIDELHPVLGGQPTHEADQPNDNNPFLDLACTMQFTIDKVNEVDKKADTKLAKAQNLKDVANVAIARDNLGLGTSATMNATSTLSDRTDQTATIKAVNDVNRDVVTAQKTANTANDKANAAQTRADSAYNLARTKRDINDQVFHGARITIENTGGYKSLNLANPDSNKEVLIESDIPAEGLSFICREINSPYSIFWKASLQQKSGSLALLSDVENAKKDLDKSKQDKLLFVGKGPEVMKVGAFGIGMKNSHYQGNTLNSVANSASGFYGAENSREGFNELDDNAVIINPYFSASYSGLLAITNSGSIYSNSKNGSGGFRGWKKFLNQNDANSAVKAQNGWWKCGTTGLLIQWGRARIASGNEFDSQKVSFPVSFSAPPFSITTSDIDGGKVTGSKNATSSNFEVVAGSKPPITIGYIAIGY